MRYLLDTHALLWWMEDSHRMPESVKSLISDQATTIVMSAATAWELAIKVGKKKLSLHEDPIQVGLTCGFLGLEINFQHAERVKTLPRHHTDPFDRILVAQALQEDLTLITRDVRIQLYDVKTLWG